MPYPSHSSVPRDSRGGSEAAQRLCALRKARRTRAQAESRAETKDSLDEIGPPSAAQDVRPPSGLRYWHRTFSPAEPSPSLGAPSPPDLHRFPEAALSSDLAAPVRLRNSCRDDTPYSPGLPYSPMLHALFDSIRSRGQAQPD